MNRGEQWGERITENDSNLKFELGIGLAPKVKLKWPGMEQIGFASTVVAFPWRVACGALTVSRKLLLQSTVSGEESGVNER